MKIGAQLYTVRDFCQTPEDFAETLKKISEMGYTTVQVSGTCVYEAQWLKEQLKKNGLECVVTHYFPDRMKADATAVAQAHEVFGCENVGLGYYLFDQEKEDLGYGEFYETWFPVAKRIKEAGKYFVFHNHDGEFQRLKGKRILEKILEDFPPEYLGITMDTFWVQAAGGDPGDWIRRLKGRVPCIHLKDMSYGRRMEVVGEGNMNFESIFKAAEEGDVRYMLVEQDDCNGENPFACLQRSYENLKAWGFE